MKNTKKQQAEFIKKCEAVLIDLGAEKVINDERHSFTIKTSIGRLFLRIDDDNDIMFTVYGNFKDEPTKAKEIFGHWKQNLHSVGSVSESLERVKNYYTSILNLVQLPK